MKQVPESNEKRINKIKTIKLNEKQNKFKYKYWKDDSHIKRKFIDHLYIIAWPLDMIQGNKLIFYDY